MRLPLLLALLLLAGLAVGADGGFAVEEVTTREADGVCYLDARLRYVLTPAVAEALESGIPLTIRLDLEVLGSREYLWDETIVALELRYELRYHALSRQYRIRNLFTHAQQGYPSRAQALSALGRIEDLPLVERQRLQPGRHYEARLRAALDTAGLPAPMRLKAWFSPQWRLETPWRRWPLDS
jgi:hypothetical protein